VCLGDRCAYEDGGFTKQHDEHQQSGEAQVHGCERDEVHHAGLQSRANEYMQNKAVATAVHYAVCDRAVHVDRMIVAWLRATEGAGRYFPRGWGHCKFRPWHQEQEKQVAGYVGTMSKLTVTKMELEILQQP
jgi:hypothetical protein